MPKARTSKSAARRSGSGTASSPGADTYGQSFDAVWATAKPVQQEE
ncbi:hypothetical protein [Streptomyces sp. PA5.6]